MNDSEHAIAAGMAEADQAMTRRDFAAALAALEGLEASRPQDLDYWRRLASLRRMSGQPAKAIAAIDGALAISPLDFVSLLFRAEMLEQGGSPDAGEAYGRALANRPPEPLPAAIQPAIARAESSYANYQQQLETRLNAQLDGATLSAVEHARAERLISNISRRTRRYPSLPTHFDYPGLRECEFHDRRQFPWLAEWEAATDMIESELSALIAADSSEKMPYVQYGAEAPLAQWRELNHNDAWSSIHLIQRGLTIDANATLCPKTMELLSGFPQPIIAGCGANAMFSLLAPHTHIPPHTGVANFRLVCHLPLIVPANCWFRVGETRREWTRGEAFVFDDTIEHEAANESDELRIVMIIDCWHPDLSPAERETISAIVGAAAMPGTDL